MIIGADLGSFGVKTDSGITFENKVTTEDKWEHGCHTLELGGVHYIIGEGEYETEVNKADRPNTLPSLFAAIALSSPDQVNQVVVGLPIQHYKSQKDILKQRILDNRIQRIKLDGRPARDIVISDVEVAPEGVAAFHSLSPELKNKIGNQDIVIIDIGGRTTDICLYKLVKGKRKIDKHESIMVGMLGIYDECMKAFNSKYVLDLDLEDGERTLKNGLYVNGKKENINPIIDPIFEKHVTKIFKDLNMHFSIKNTQSLLVGGGGVVLEPLFKKRLEHVLLANEPVFGNAIGFKRVGEALWNR